MRGKSYSSLTSQLLTRYGSKTCKKSWWFFDHLQKDGSNLIERLQPDNGVSRKPSLSDVRYQSMYKGVDINKNESTKLTTLNIESVNRLPRYFVDLTDTQLLHGVMPLQKR